MEKGDKGDTESKSEQGDTGEKGDTGPQGAKGEKGDNGETPVITVVEDTLLTSRKGCCYPCGYLSYRSLYIRFIFGFPDSGRKDGKIVMFCHLMISCV